MLGRQLGARWAVGTAFACELISLACLVAGPLLLKALTDGLTQPAAGGVSCQLLILLFVTSLVLPSLLTGVKHRSTAIICSLLTSSLSIGALRSQLPVLTQAKQGTGEFQGALERLPFSLQLIIEGLLWQVAPLMCQILSALAVMAMEMPFAYVASTFALLAAVLAIAYVNATRWRARSVAYDATLTGMSGSLGDVVRNAERIICNGNLARELGHLAEQMTRRQSAAVGMAASLMMLTGTQYLVIGAGLMVLLLLGAHDVSAGVITAGSFIMLQAYILRLTQPLGGFMFLLLQSGVALANVGAILDLTTADRIIPDGEGNFAPGPAAVRFENISLSYDGHSIVLKGICGEIHPGRFVAVVGPNGSGKSTLGRLIGGIAHPTDGRIWVGEADLAEVAHERRHQHVIYVPQQVSLFNRPLRENALYPPTSLEADDVAALLAQWSFHEDGRDLDLDCVVGEAGARLSGGQRQKLELARIAGIDTGAIVIDEGTSALDERSERRIVEWLRRHFSGRTTIIMITHSAAVAASADEVIFLRDGAIHARGAHDQLLQVDDGYRHFWQGS